MSTMTYVQHKKDENCVEETLKDILKAQKSAAEHHKEQHHSSWRNGCTNAIDELLNPPKPQPIKKPTHTKNTIPFILYTKELCPFKGEGVLIYHCNCHHEDKFKCVSSFIFRINELKHDCAELELLTFKGNDECECHIHQKCSPCDQIDGEKVQDLVRTGICIKVDASCFCGISCLPPVYLEPKHNKHDC